MTDPAGYLTPLELSAKLRQHDDQIAHLAEAVYQHLALDYDSSGDLEVAKAHVHALNEGKYWPEPQPPEPPAPSPTPLTRTLAVWTGSKLPAAYHSVGDIVWAIKDFAAGLPVEYDNLEWVVKAGEGGIWQGAFDPNPLALSSLAEYREQVALAQSLGVTLIPYINLRGRLVWQSAEFRHIWDLGLHAPRVVLNLENGPAFWNGPTDYAGVQRYLDDLDSYKLDRSDTTQLELCTIPRQAIIDALGGTEVFRLWASKVDRISWEVYDGVAYDLNLPDSFARVSEWLPHLPPDVHPEYYIPLVNKNRAAIHTSSVWAQRAGELHVWHLFGNY